MPVLDAQLAGETQIGAVEADEFGCHLLEGVEPVDQFVHRKIAVAGEGDGVAVDAVGVVRLISTAMSSIFAMIL